MNGVLYVLIVDNVYVMYCNFRRWLTFLDIENITDHIATEFPLQFVLFYTRYLSGTRFFFTRTFLGEVLSLGRLLIIIIVIIIINRLSCPDERIAPIIIHAIVIRPI